MLESRVPVVEIDGLRFAWPGGPTIIDLEAFEATQGESVFIEGPSGTGKSTLLSLLGGIVVADQGHVQVLGTDLGSLRLGRRDRFRAEHIGFVFQLFNLVPYLSVLDNIRLACDFSRERRRRALERSGSIAAEAERLLRALELEPAQLGKRTVYELSIGQQQRVALARALMGSPEILIADEPTSALDEGTCERFVELLFAECRAVKTTVLFVSHDTRLGPLFDRRIALAEINRAAGAAQ